MAPALRNGGRAPSSGNQVRTTYIGAAVFAFCDAIRSVFTAIFLHPALAGGLTHIDVPPLISQVAPVIGGGGRVGQQALPRGRPATRIARGVFVAICLQQRRHFSSANCAAWPDR